MRERDREREREIYIYIYVERARDERPETRDNSRQGERHSMQESEMRQRGRGETAGEREGRCGLTPSNLMCEAITSRLSLGRLRNFSTDLNSLISQYVGHRPKALPQQTFPSPSPVDVVALAEDQRFRLMVRF